MNETIDRLEDAIRQFGEYVSRMEMVAQSMQRAADQMSSAATRTGEAAGMISMASRR